MATFELPMRRLIVAGAFAAAVAIAPAIAAFAGPAPTVGTVACPSGQEEDPFTYACVPHTTPGGVGAFGAPSEQQLTACGGPHRSQCLEGQLYGPGTVQVPHVSTNVQQSP
jgi:hypothetical protein